jgi:hypothetical protein
MDARRHGRKTSSLLGFTIAAAGLWLTAAIAIGQGSGDPPDAGFDPAPRFQYAAKFVCGIAESGSNNRVIGGDYSTAINIHNPNGTNVEFLKKIALTFPPQGQAPGEISELIEDQLAPDESLEVDCGQIPSGFGLNPVDPPVDKFFFKGFVVILSPLSLDVTAVYTAGFIPDGFFTGERPGIPRVLVQSIDVEQIAERRLTGPPVLRPGTPGDSDSPGTPGRRGED